MTISGLKQIIKTSGKLQEDLIIQLSESRDWSEIRRNQKINITLSNPEFLELFRVYGKRIYTLIDSCVTISIEEFYSTRISESLTPTNPDELEELFNSSIAGNTEKSRNTLILQQKSKIAQSNKLSWVYKYFSNILNEIKITPELIKPISLSAVNSSHVDNLVCFDCNIDGVETQQAIIDKYDTAKSDIILAERYSKDQHGTIKEIFYEDFQYYWLREPIKEFSRKKSLRKIAGQSFGKFVGKYETSDKVRILGFYRITEKDKKNNSPAEDVEIEIINMEKLDDDIEVTLSKEELLEFKSLTKKAPEDFIKHFTDSCAPHIQGNNTPKLAIILAEIGPSKIVEKYRPHIHILLEGDPGTAKSEMLKWFGNISYMGVYADAPNASSRGLMYGQEEHGKRKILKAGLMVRNQKLYLDELDKMGETRQELNTAMEQQIASYHKNPFDIDTEINCTVIAAANPQFGKWKDEISLLDQFKPIKPELLSRFLIIRVLKSGDTRSRLTHIIDTMKNREKIKPKYTQRQIAGLINHCRKLNPDLSIQAEKLILDFAVLFDGIKQQDAESSLDFEVRAQINVIRVSTAIAKLLQKEIIDETCVRIAISFINECNRSLGLITEVPTTQSDLYGTPVDRDVTFLQIIKLIQMPSENNCFSESDLIKEMLKYEQFWRTEESASGYWRRHNPNYNAKSEYYEPHTGRFKKI